MADENNSQQNNQQLTDEDNDGHNQQSATAGGRTMQIIGLHGPAPNIGASRDRQRRRLKKPPMQQEQQLDAEAKSDADDSGVSFRLGNCDAAEPIAQDLQAHPIFCEMDELLPAGNQGELQWQETARWIKFEEDVDEGGQRWSKPHVATISLFALFEVRNSVFNGQILLDCEGQTMEDICSELLDKFIESGQLDADSRDLVKAALLKRHLHLKGGNLKSGIGAKIRSIADIGNRLSHRDLERQGSSAQNMSSSSKLDTEAAAAAAAAAGGSASIGSELGGSSAKFNQNFMKKIPEGAETSNILVGSIDLIDKPLIAFVRLRAAVILGDLTEVPVPTRFIYVLLGPKGQRENFHEMGRSMATLMSDEVFHDNAYFAKSREDLLSGIDEFLSACTVLPPNEWDPSIRIEPPKEVPSQEMRKVASAIGVSASSAGLVEGKASSSNMAESAAAAAASGNGGGGSSSGVEPIKLGTGAETSDAALTRTGRLFGGLIADVKRKAPFYLSDFKDALQFQTVGALFFLYIACLAPIITFGGLLADATEGSLGAMESIVAGALCGVVFALFSGQPLTILGSTGPVLVFETIIFDQCKVFGWDYLSFRMWIGLWIFLILLLFVAFDLSALVRYITRFTEESFAGLIALIFIVEAIKKLLHVATEFPIDTAWQPNATTDLNCSCSLQAEYNSSQPLAMGQHKQIPSFAVANAANTSVQYYVNHSAIDYFSWDSYANQKICRQHRGQWVGSGCSFSVPDVFFLSCLLFIGTFCMSYGLKLMRNSNFFPNRIRSLISDFAVMIAIVSMTLVDRCLQLHTPKLQVPQRVQPTLGYDARGWVMPPFGHRGQNPVYTIPLALLPALLATILIFMDQQITAVIVNRKENKLKKGLGYHLDLLVVAALIAVNSVLGIPWFVAATVLSINHVMSLKIESESAAPGERPKFLGCRENRATGLIIFSLIGLSVLMTPILQLIPMPVLYGVFLFMGISSLNGLQLVQRFSLFFMPQKHQPDYNFLRHVKIWQVHKFTLIQIGCLILLWVVKGIKQISIFFPIMVLAMCFIRKALDFVFSQSELLWLDDVMPPIGCCQSAEVQHNDTEAAAADRVELQQTVSKEAFDLSQEVRRTGIWRQLTDSKQIVCESANNEELEEQQPGIVVLPPSPGNSPESERKQLAG